MSFSFKWSNPTSLIIAIVVSVVSSIFYAWLVIRFRRLEIATLKCIGYTNNDIRTIILGEILWVSFSSFIVVFEFLIHWTAIDAIRIAFSPPGTGEINGMELFISPLDLILTVGIFLLAQIGGIWLAYRKVLKLRPIVALRVMK